ncbi:hypothetical protein IWX78_000495 [Mycetocola sp. CAN_C7]|uniref:hypothetical protein n=1 Tax=Mycetocola sp. CAN_C7 TaxID=2787724 RepID=UPI0018CA0D80
MIETFLRRPRGAAELTADAVRLVGVLCIAVALIGWPLLDVAVFALALLGLVVPRFLGIRPGLDIALGITVLVAAWSALLDLYNAIPYWDFVVHFALNGLVAAALYILAVRLEVIPDPTTTRVSLGAIVALTTSFGLAAGVIWEIAEWLGHTYIDETIFVGYNDTIGDLVAGGLGSILAGLAGRRLAAESRYVAAHTDPA